jgi:putative MATE family efflux protein
VYTGDQAVRAIAAEYIRINSLSFFLLPFIAPMEMAFKTTQQVRLPMIVSIVVFSSNTLINYILIFGKLGFPALGVAGAAIGTVTARVLEVCIDAFFAFRKQNVFCGSVRSYFGWNPELIRRVIKNATPTTINELLWSLGQSMFVAAFNRIGTTAYAAYQAANVIFNIFIFAAFSIGDAALILIGEKLGEGDKAYTWKLANHIIKVTIIVSLIIGGAAILMSWPLSGMFRLSAEGRRSAFYVLIVLGATMFVDMFNGVMITGVLRGGGDTRFAMLAECGCIWLIAVPLAFLAALVWHLPIYLALLVIRAESFIRAFILLKRYISRKWMNTVIENL